MGETHVVCPMSRATTYVRVVKLPPDVEPDQEQLTMVWRSALLCDKQALKVEEISIELESMDLGGSIN